MTPRDPLAALLADWRSVPRNGFDEEGRIRHEIEMDCADQVEDALDATRPSGDEALRAAAQEVLAADGALAREEPGGDRRWDAALAALDGALDRATLATPSSTPDVEGLRYVHGGDLHRCDWRCHA